MHAWSRELQSILPGDDELQMIVCLQKQAHNHVQVVRRYAVCIVQHDTQRRTAATKQARKPRHWKARVHVQLYEAKRLAQPEAHGVHRDAVPQVDVKCARPQRVAAWSFQAQPGASSRVGAGACNSLR